MSANSIHNDMTMEIVVRDDSNCRDSYPTFEKAEHSISLRLVRMDRITCTSIGPLEGFCKTQLMCAPSLNFLQYTFLERFAGIVVGGHSWTNTQTHTHTTVTSRT